MPHARGYSSSPFRQPPRSVLPIPRRSAVVTLHGTQPAGSGSTHLRRHFRPSLRVFSSPSGTVGAPSLRSLQGRAPMLLVLFWVSRRTDRTRPRPLPLDSGTSPRALPLATAHYRTRGRNSVHGDANVETTHGPRPVAEQWRWRSYRFYLLDEAGPVRVNEGWTKIPFRAPAESSTHLRRHFRLPPFANSAKDGGTHCTGDASEIKTWALRLS
jgi:hypothetical protein